MVLQPSCQAHGVQICREPSLQGSFPNNSHSYVVKVSTVFVTPLPDSLEIQRMVFTGKALRNFIRGRLLGGICGSQAAAKGCRFETKQTGYSSVQGFNSANGLYCCWSLEWLNLLLAWLRSSNLLVTQRHRETVLMCLNVSCFTLIWNKLFLIHTCPNNEKRFPCDQRFSILADPTAFSPRTAFTSWNDA